MVGRKNAMTNTDLVRAVGEEIARRWVGHDLPNEAAIHSLDLLQLRALAEHVISRHLEGQRGVVDTAVAADMLLQESKLAYRAGQQSISALMAAEDEAIAQSQALAHASFRAGVAACVARATQMAKQGQTAEARVIAATIANELESITDLSPAQEQK